MSRPPKEVIEPTVLYLYVTRDASTAPTTKKPKTQREQGLVRRMQCTRRRLSHDQKWR
jgi:hypothetical protein